MKKHIALLALLLCFAFAAFMVWSNVSVQLTAYTVRAANLPDGFSGLRIAHLSDLHDAVFGEENARLLAQLKRAQPDVIFCTGDMIDSNRTNVAATCAFMRQAAALAPTYYVTGNHEARVPEAYAALKAGLLEAGVVVLENEAAVLHRHGDTLRLVGLHAPSMDKQFWRKGAQTVLSEALSPLTGDDAYTVLLAHHPEFFDVYAAGGVDLVFCGHAHGGQFRLPLLGGLFAPGQGFLPEYDAGVFSSGGTAMVVSRGLGNSQVPFRFNNRPEIVLVTLEAQGG